MVRHPPDILITTPESLYLMLTSQAAKIFDGVEQVIVDEIHAVAQTKRGAHLALTLERLAEAAGRDVQRIGLSATQNPLEEVGRFLVGPKRTCTIVDTGVRKPLDLKIHVPVESMVEPGDAGVRARPVRGHRPGGHAQVDLAGDLPQAARAGARAPLDADLRQQPPRRRAARAAAERARRGADRARPPRLAGARGAAARRGPAEGRRAAVPGRHLEPRARHRHGRDRPRAAGRVAEVGHRRAAADRPRRPQRRRHLQGPHLPEVPRRPASSARSSPSACARARSRRTVVPRNPLDVLAQQIVAMAAVGRRRRPERRRAARARHAHLHRTPSSRRAQLENVLDMLDGRYPSRGVRRAARPHRLGPRGRHDPRPPRRPRARHHQRRHDPRPRAVLRQPAGRPPRRRARRGDGLRGAARARRSCSARRAGGSRRSRATA